MCKKLTDYAQKGLWPVFFLIMILKYSYYKYSYFPIIDDNNMYGIFSLQQNAFNDILMKYRMFTTRPAAAFVDAYFWTKFWDRLGLSLILMSIILYVTCYLLYKVFEKSNMNIGTTVLVVFALLPFGSEATYWLSASTRIVAGLFFTALALYLFCLSLEAYDNKKKYYALLFLFFISNLLSYGFYEQIIVLSFISALFVFAASWQKLRSKWVIAFPLINFAIIGLWYKVFSSEGNMASRGQIIKGNYIEHFNKVTAAIREIWKKCCFDLYYDGFRRSIKLILADQAYIFLGAAAALCAALFFITYKEGFSRSLKINIIKLLLGIALFAVPFAPFYPMKLIWITNRNIFTSFIGLGLIIEAFLNVITINRFFLVFKSIIVSIFAFVFLISNVYELNYYRNVGLIDREITSKIAQIPLDDFFHKGKSLIILNADAVFIDSISNRIGTCLDADWALNGAIKAHLRIKDCGYTLPIHNNSYALPMKKSLIYNSYIYGIDDSRNMIPLSISKDDDKLIYFSSSDGSEFGKLELLQNDTVVFYLNK